MRFAFFLSFLAIAVAVAVACGGEKFNAEDDDPVTAPVRDSGSSADPDSSAPPVDAGSDVEGDADAAFPAVCSDLPVPTGAQFVGHIEDPPAATGGTLTNGVWKLTTLHAWKSKAAVTQAFPGGFAIRFAGDKFDLAGVASGRNQQMSGTFSTNGVQLTLAASCVAIDAKDAGATTGSWQYTVESPTKLHLFTSADAQQEVFEYVLEPLP